MRHSSPKSRKNVAHPLNRPESGHGDARDKLNRVRGFLIDNDRSRLDYAHLAWVGAWRRKNNRAQRIRQ
jgi:hypothetical protein